MTQPLSGVYAVPPLPRNRDAGRSLNFDAAERVARHIEEGGITRFLYGGNAFLYHASLDEFQALVEWLSGFASTRWPIPSIGPSFGRAIDQARILKQYSFPAAMMLPCGDPRDGPGMEAGLREIAAEAGMPLIVYLKSEDGFGSDKDAGLDAVGRLVDSGVAMMLPCGDPRDGPGMEAGLREIAAEAGMPLIVYLKSEDGFGSDKDAGLDAVGRLVDSGVAMAIKYAVVRDNPLDDAYLDGLLRRVDRSHVISGMGERPAIQHLRDYRLGGLTTGSGCIAPRRCQELFDAACRGDWTRAGTLRAGFMPLEDLRDAWGPARVLHHATDLAGIAATGPIPPYVSALDATQLAELGPIARALRERDA